MMLLTATKEVSFYNYPVRMFGPKKGQSNKEKKDAEKAKVHSEFEGKQIDDIKKEYAESLIACMDELDDELSSVKSGRASTKIFDDLEVKAYGEMQYFCDVA